jgi:DNA-directed RNA polymerase IV and V subunit 2
VEIKKDQCQQEVRILSDAGRILRPFLVVSNLLKIKGSKSEHKSFQSLLDNGVIKLIGPEEEDFKTAWGVQYLFGKEGKSSVKYTHCELDMSFLLGLSCLLVPFANRDHVRC